MKYKECKQCRSKIISKYGKVFCSRSCAATFNNLKKPKTIIACLNCNKNFEIYPSEKHKRKYCSKKCGAEHRSNSIWIPIKEKIARDEIFYDEWSEQINRYYRRFLIEECGASCTKCGWAKINEFTKKVPIELEHKDGDCTNNSLSNLELLCPNCHSLTATYKGANRGNGGSARYNNWKKYFKS